MRVGFIGLGTMGSSMALNAQKGGHDLIVHDLRREAAEPHLKAGAAWAEGARGVGELADVVFTSLPGPREAEAVGEELLASMRPGVPWFDLTTNSPTVARRLHAKFAAKGIPMLDAPVSGGPHGAKSRKLALLVGGDRAVFDRFRTVLDAIGDQILYIGPIGAGSVAKLVHKDVTLATELARELGVPMRIASLTHAEMTEALNRGWGERDSRSPMLLQEERAGVEIKVPAEAIRAVLERDG
ncbi:MAG: hypothetical protein A3G24_23895 [Betaproteobacteria bacterium RIFCSPLOWO2_12_FULL_62_13]|nr:MAG: hypothetical protein A3G24_23895 [Betaproteobacteria bacterium RIFCSPLOWO2_12_FULL_62_13]